MIADWAGLVAVNATGAAQITITRLANPVSLAGPGRDLAAALPASEINIGITTGSLIDR